MKQLGLFLRIATIVLLVGCNDDDDRKVIRFADPEVKALCVENWDTDSDGELSYEEAAAVESIGRVFTDNVKISSFNELEYFTAIRNIDAEAFCGCRNLTSVRIPRGVVSIGYYAFRDNESLQDIVIPAGVTSIDSFAFQNCTGLGYLDIPDSVESLGDNLIVYCSNISKFSGKYASDDALCLVIGGVLKSYAPAGKSDYVLPADVVAVGSYSFKYCNKLKEITIHDDVKSVGYQAFCGCESLETAVVGSGVISVEANAFQSCVNLTKIYFKSITPPTGAVLMFDDIAPTAKIYVPKESVEAYKNSEYWSIHADRIEGCDF